jgi:hypothetical protein
MTLYTKALAYGLQIDNWQSDLYIKYSPKAKSIIEQFATKEEMANLRQFVGTDKEIWLEIPFAYDPYWTTKEGKK